LYLAGGFRSGWQDRVIESLPGWRILDPRSHGYKEEKLYTLWDLEAIRQADWVLVYQESSNPAHYNCSFEMGYAVALGKKVIYLNELAAKNDSIHRYTGMLRQSATIEVGALLEAIALLQRLPVPDGD
jgi:nucleoside 2-deoxyribosyltransferase